LIADILDQVGAAIDRAHQAGIVHRDLKPDNIMVEERPDGSIFAKVLDFGIAKLKDRTDSPSNLTATGTVLGTVAYMSPEQCRGTEIDGRSDIYSLGIVLYEMVTGRVPFYSTTPSAIVAGHVSDAPPPPRAFAPEVPAGVEEVILASLAKRPADRPQTAGELSRRLRAALSDHVGPTVVLPAKTQPVVAAATAAAAPITDGRHPVEYVPRTEMAATGSTTPARQTSPVIWVLVGALMVAIAGASAAAVFSYLNASRSDAAIPVVQTVPVASEPAQPSTPSSTNVPASNKSGAVPETGFPGAPAAPSTPVAPGPSPSSGSADESAARTFMISWTRSIESKDLTANLDHYAETVDYYMAGPVPKRRIAADRAKAFARFEQLKITVNKIHSVTPSADGTRLTVVFDKAWDFRTRTGSPSTGAVRQELVLERHGNSFLIVGEHDLATY
jgi:serine/threonine-protein kinase